MQFTASVAPVAERGPESYPRPIPAAAWPVATGDARDARDPWRRIYVGVLTQVTPHPNADREVVVEVDAGWGRLSVVTGGSYVEIAGKVAVALPGERVFGAANETPRLRKLKKGRICGVLSEGMLCSVRSSGCPRTAPPSTSSPPRLQSALP